MAGRQGSRDTARIQLAAVRCAGKPTTVEMGETGKYDRVVQQRTEPCGWKGRRKNDRELYGPHGRTAAAEAEPCPRCGGRVEVAR